MSIASEITRLQTAKADIKAAIEGKGVTVPSAATLDDYADLVEAIQTGGGGGGISVSKTTVRIKNATSPSRGVIRITLTDSFGLGAFSQSHASGVSRTYTDMAIFDDGTNNPYFVFHTGYNPESITYNDTVVPYTTSGSGSQWDVHVELPTGFDNSYEFVLN